MITLKQICCVSESSRKTLCTYSSLSPVYTVRFVCKHPFVSHPVFSFLLLLSPAPPSLTNSSEGIDVQIRFIKLLYKRPFVFNVLLRRHKRLHPPPVAFVLVEDSFKMAGLPYSIGDQAKWSSYSCPRSPHGSLTRYPGGSCGTLS